MEFFRIHNWEKFQHYSKRNPPWIRLYQTLLRDIRYQQLTDTQRSHLIGLFLLAAQHDNKLSANQGWLKHELCTKSSIELKTLLASGWIDDITEHASKDASASNNASSGASVVPLRDRSTETDNSETETEVLALGQFSNVALTVSEKQKLVEKFGGAGTDLRIEALSEGIASKGYKYKSHYATILSWERKNGSWPSGNGHHKESHAERVTRKNRETAALFHGDALDTIGDGNRSGSPAGADSDVLYRPE